LTTPRPSRTRFFGILAALSAPHDALVLTLVYIAYQLADADDAPAERLGDLVEYAAGYIAGLAIRAIAAFIRI